MFTLCLGKDGGFFQMGGYDTSYHLTPQIKWVPLIKDDPYAYRIKIGGISMNGH